MNEAQKEEIIQRAKAIKKDKGGMIFAFPIEAENPFSKYVLVTDVGDCNMRVFAEELDITEAAQSILMEIEFFHKDGIELSYEKDVRFMFFEAQKNAPSIPMKRLRKTFNF